MGQTGVEAITKGVDDAEGAGDAEAGDDCDDAAEPGPDSSSPALSPRPRLLLPLLGRLHPETVASFDTSVENERQVCVGTTSKYCISGLLKRLYFCSPLILCD